MSGTPASGSPPIPTDEERRLAALYRCEILDTPPEEAFDRVTRLACRVFDVPVALVSLVDRHRQWFKSAQGVDVPETDREIAFCAHGICEEGQFIVPDALEDSRFRDNPMVTNPPHVRFYAGVPLTVEGRYRVGMLCIKDYRPRVLSEEDLEMLQDLGQTVVDSLERRRAQLAVEAGVRELEKEHRELQLLAAAFETSQATLISDASGVIQRVNPAFTRITGYEAEDVIGQTPGILSSGLHGPDFYRDMWQTLRTSGSWEGEIWNRRKDGMVYPEWAAISAVRNSTGKIAYFVAVFHDISEQKRQEESLRKARQEAERANRVKSDFLAAVSHDLRTPLNAIIGFSELLSGTELDETQRYYLKLCRTAGENLLSLIDTLLDLSRIEAGRAVLKREPFALHRLLEQQLDLMRLTARKRGLTLELDVDPAVPTWVEGDAARLGEILSNLVSNALKFTEQGGVHVRVERDSGERLRFSVRDTGIGIPEEQRDLVFEPFTQVHAAERGYGGSGLGLKICREFVHLMDGEMGVEDTPGGGTTFTFTAVLPEVEAAPEATGADEPDVGSTRRRADGERLRVLVAEDEPVNALLVRTMLEQADCRVDVVEDGHAAVRAWAEKDYDLILMDLQMPRLDGEQATRMVRELEAESGRPRTPVVILSAHAVESVRDRCLAAGCDDYMTKPLKRAALHDVLARVAV